MRVKIKECQFFTNPPRISLLKLACGHDAVGHKLQTASYKNNVHIMCGLKKNKTKYWFTQRRWPIRNWCYIVRTVVLSNDLCRRVRRSLPYNNTLQNKLSKFDSFKAHGFTKHQVSLYWHMDYSFSYKAYMW